MATLLPALLAVIPLETLRRQELDYVLQNFFQMRWLVVDHPFGKSDRVHILSYSTGASADRSSNKSSSSLGALTTTGHLGSLTSAAPSVAKYSRRVPCSVIQASTSAGDLVIPLDCSTALIAKLSTVTM